MVELPEEKQVIALRRIAELGERKQGLQEELNAVMNELRDVALEAHTAGADGSRIIELGRIARATLYSWLPADQRRRRQGHVAHQDQLAKPTRSQKK